MYVWRLEDNWEFIILLFHYVGPKDQIQVVRLGCGYLSLPSHLVGREGKKEGGRQWVLGIEPRAL